MSFPFPPPPGISGILSRMESAHILTVFFLVSRGLLSFGTAETFLSFAKFSVSSLLSINYRKSNRKWKESSRSVWFLAMGSPFHQTFLKFRSEVKWKGPF